MRSARRVLSQANRRPNMLSIGHFCWLIFLLTLCANSAAPCRASGVFELELVDFQINKLKSATKPLGPSGSQAPIRMFICLKEAFTSQLQGPCTFGNASIALGGQQSHQWHHTTLPPLTSGALQEESSKATNADRQDFSEAQADNRKSISSKTATVHGEQEQQQQQQQQQGSLLTNAVRIQFTFRWTKSFTIILSAEQLGLDARETDEPKKKSANTAGTAKGTEAATNQSGEPISQSLIIDRYVLTENEVLPSLETNLSRQPWTSRHQRSLHSSIVYKFRVYCALNYFGDGCMTFCRARNDQFGHYNCSSNGQKVCHEGWSGADCERAKCRAGCNQQHGYCDQPDTCQCRHGWRGARCDECQPYPGCKNGYCLSPWQCNCQPNWGGVLCDQDLNYCGSHEPCLNNGTCQNVAPGRYKCHCAPGFAGVNCETGLSALAGLSGGGGGPLTQLSAGCALNPCLNGGTCYGFNALQAGSANAQPAAPTFGLVRSEQNQTVANSELASLDFLADSSMSSGADQIGAGLLYRCQCLAGWTGDYCQWAEALVPNSDLLLGEQALSLTGPFAVSPAHNLEQHGNEAQEQKGNQTPDALETLITSTTGASFEFSLDDPIQLTTAPSLHQARQLEMRHLISGVVLASAVGVFMAALMLAWCCLVAIEHNKCSFIQMNVVRGAASNLQQTASSSSGASVVSTVMSSTLRRVHDKIRDSFRSHRAHSRGRQIKPETKLSIDNVLRPPPSYEESNYASKLDMISDTLKSQYKLSNNKKSNNRSNKLSLIDTTVSLATELKSDDYQSDTSSEIQNQELCQKNTQKNTLVKSENEVVVPIEAIKSNAPPQPSSVAITSAHLNCPKHGHLYRKQQQQQQLYSIPEQQAATTIEIEYKSYKPSTKTCQPYRHPRDIG